MAFISPFHPGGAQGWCWATLLSFLSHFSPSHGHHSKFFPLLHSPSSSSPYKRYYYGSSTPFQSPCLGRDWPSPRHCPRPLLDMWQPCVCRLDGIFIHGVTNGATAASGEFIPQETTGGGSMELPNMVHLGLPAVPTQKLDWTWSHGACFLLIWRLPLHLTPFICVDEHYCSRICLWHGQVPAVQLQQHITLSRQTCKTSFAITRCWSPVDCVQ